MSAFFVGQTWRARTFGAHGHHYALVAVDGLEPGSIQDYTVAIEGFTAPESDAMLAFLYAHSVRPEFTCRHRWTMGDVVLWDNRSLLHCVVGDATGPRLLHKATMAGDPPS